LQFLDATEVIKRYCNL